MLVIISVASLSSGGLEVCVQRPQHHAKASRIYHSSEQVRTTLLKFGIVEKALDEVLKLLPQLGTGERLNFPPVAGWGAKSSAAVLAKFVHLESIPKDCREWRVNAANASALADTLCRERDRALLFRTLATLRTDIALFEDVQQLRWKGPTPAFTALAARLD